MAYFPIRFVLKAYSGNNMNVLKYKCMSIFIIKSIVKLPIGEYFQMYITHI